MADDNDVAVVFGAQLQGFRDGVAEAKQLISSIADPVKALMGSLGEIGTIIASVFAVDKIEGFFEKMTDLGVQTERFKAILGTSADGVQTLDVAARASGSSLGSLATAVERMSFNLARAAAGSEQQRAAMAALGIETKNFLALNTDEKLALLSDRFSQIKDGGDKDAIAIALLGRAGANMIPVFNQGAAAIEEFRAIVQRAGSGDVPGFSAAAHELHMQGIELDESWTGLGKTIMVAFQPAVSGLVKILTQLVQSFNDSVREGGAMYYVVESLAVAARALAVAFAISVAAVQTLWEVTKDVVYAMGESFMGLARIIKDAMTFNWADIKEAWANLQDNLTARAKVTAANMEGVMRNLVGDLKTIFQDGADAQVKIEQTKNARLNMTNKDAVSAAMEAAQGKIKAADMAYQQTAERLNSEAKISQITEGQKTAMLLAALDQRHAAEMAAVNGEMAIHGLSAAQYQKLVNEKAQLDQKYFGDRQKLLDQAVQAEYTKWNTAFSAVESSFNGQLRGMLAGTTSFAQASKAILGDMVIWSIEQVEKLALKWLAGELAKTTATTAGVAARTGAEQGGFLASSLMEVGSVIKSIMNSAAQTFAGVFGFMAPMMGPAAVGPAAASGAAVSAVAGTIQAFDVGTPYIMSSGLAIVHEGEEIKPARGSGPWEPSDDGAGGTNVSIGLSIQAVDAKSFTDLLASNPNALAGPIKKAIRNGLIPSPA